MLINNKVVQNKENLRLSAVLNAFTGSIDFATKLLVSFFVTPITVAFLGPIYFGAWQVLGQLNQYMATADLRAATSIKYLISRDRSVKSEEELREGVSAGFYSFFLMFPIYIIFGSLIVWYAPELTGVPTEYIKNIRIAAIVLVTTFVVSQFFFLYESMLEGMNLAFKRLGMRAVVTIIGGGATVGVLYLGYGVLGISLVQLLIVILNGVLFYFTVKRNIPWFYLVRVDRSRIIAFVKLSVLYLLLKMSDLLCYSIDLILMGYFLGPKIVSMYAITKYLTIGVFGVIRVFGNGASMGIAKFIGEKNYSKLLEARSQIISFQLIVMILGGAVVCLFNQSFVNLWSQSQYYLGGNETLLTVLISSITILINIDSSIINATMNLKRKILITFLSSLISIGMAFVLTPIYGTIGLLSSILLGLLFLSVSTTFLLKLLTFEVKVFYNVFFSRTSLIGLSILFLLTKLSQEFIIKSWGLLGLAVVALSILVSIIVWMLGCNKFQRKVLINTIKSIKKSK